jgi:hypothetical protein
VGRSQASPVPQRCAVGGKRKAHAGRKHASNKLHQINLRRWTAEVIYDDECRPKCIGGG